MNEFDIKAAGWDMDPMHWKRSEAVANEIIESIPLNITMNALEYGAGTGITSFLIKDRLREIVLMDNSAEMVRVMNNKIKTAGAENIRAVNFNLELSDYNENKFDLVFTQMVLHHIKDIENIIRKFYSLLNPDGYLAIADLYAEDGSFHGEGFTGHNGFEVKYLSDILKKSGFHGIRSRKCFTMSKKMPDNEIKEFDIFLLTGRV